MLDDPIPALKRQVAGAILVLAGQTNFFLAAKRLGIDEARLSDLRRGRVARFSVERLIRILATVDRRVEFQIIATTSQPIRWFGQPGHPDRISRHLRTRR